MKHRFKLFNVLVKACVRDEIDRTAYNTEANSLKMLVSTAISDLYQHGCLAIRYSNCLIETLRKIENNHIR